MPRMTKEARAQLEFAVISDQLTRRREAFMARLQRNCRPSDDGCVLWTGATNERGYPRMNFRLLGKASRAEHGRTSFQLFVHRIAVILKTGAPIPIDKEAGHYKCFNRVCIAHVQLETRQENLSVRDHCQRERRGGTASTST